MNISEIDVMIQHYTAAEVAVLEGKSITFNGQQMTFENLSEIRAGRQEWERRKETALRQSQGRSGFRLARFG
ncbi:hypothetical protein [Phytobacter sp. V91]|uniref:hypothetical protein n=1 Tax=Phytobacter sp. V91 TaxID=3369425 RepID=UPI003F62BF5D